MLGEQLLFVQQRRLDAIHRPITANRNVQRDRIARIRSVGRRLSIDLIVTDGPTIIRRTALTRDRFDFDW